MTAHCPVCTTEATAQREGSPYYICPRCDDWFQSPPPPKIYAGAHEAPGDAMSNDDRRVNADLAAYLFANVMKGKPGRTLDVGAKYPYLASRLQRHGCEAWAIDGDEMIEHYAHDLGVQHAVADFESLPMPTHAGAYSLVTLIHCFEHLYDPLASLRKLRMCIGDEGRVFIRMPDHGVAGYERDLTPGHYTIHPFYHCHSALLEMLAQLGDCFAVESYRPMTGYGQSDTVLKPITKRPTLAVGIIERNEKRDLPRALKSIAAVADYVAVVDTGSNDGTLAEAPGMCVDAGILSYGVWHYLGASELDDSGNWRLTNFADARNHAIKRATLGETEWYMWLDADDTLEAPDVVRRLMYWHEFDCFGAMCHQDSAKWVHHRLWKTSKGVRFAGRVHEYPILDGLHTQAVEQFIIRHDATPHTTGEDSNARNLRLLQLEFEEKPDTRTAFYLAMTHRDGGRFALAAQWFEKRIAMGVAFRDEMLFSYLYLARCHRELLDFEIADATAHAAIDIEPTWAEFWLERATIAYKRGDHDAAIRFATATLGMKPPPTMLWRELPMYTDQPPRLISWCHEHKGNMVLALQWARAVLQYVPNDLDWNKRIARLESLQPVMISDVCPTCGRAKIDDVDSREPTAPAIVSRTRPIIGLNRPGAIGDILMTLNLVPALMSENPDHDVYFFCDPRLGAMDALGSTMAAAGVKCIMDSAQWPAWAKTFDRAINLVGYPLAEGYPDKPMRHHLLQYFADEMGIEWLGTRAGNPRHWPSLELRQPSRPALTQAIPAKYATIQTVAGWSKYKQWPASRWAAVAHKLAGDGIPLVQIGAAGEPPIAAHVFSATGRTLADSIALVANARMHLGIDSFANHLTNYSWEWPADDERRAGGRRVPGVILWGSTQQDAAGYPHNRNLSAGLECQPCFRENPDMSASPRNPCINPPRASYADKTPHECMQKIRTETVIAAASELWAKVNK